MHVFALWREKQFGEDSFEWAKGAWLLQPTLQGWEEGERHRTLVILRPPPGMEKDPKGGALPHPTFHLKVESIFQGSLGT